MGKVDLEKVMSKIAPSNHEEIINKTFNININKINEDITEKITQDPLFGFSINTHIKFKQAKIQFKKQFLKTLLQINYGNISKVARIANIDRRSVHRLTNEFQVSRFRKNLKHPDYIKQEKVSNIVENVVDSYKDGVPEKYAKKIYENMEEVSKEILKDIPEKIMTLKEAEEEFERRYILKALYENKFNISLTASKIGLRYETLSKKIKKFNLLGLRTPF